MPKVDGPLFSVTATGEVGKAIAFKLGATYGRVEIKRQPAKSRTAGQAGQRDKFKAAKNQWNVLTEEEKIAYGAAAPSSWTAYNYFLFLNMGEVAYYLGALIFGHDFFNQGNVEGEAQTEDYENNFEIQLDEIPTYQDGIDPVKSWMINKLKLSLQAIEGFLITNKANIIGG